MYLTERWFVVDSRASIPMSASTDFKIKGTVYSENNEMKIERVLSSDKQ